MAFEGLPPSPNWYGSAVSDTNAEGILAYASRNSVVLLNVSGEGHTLIGYLHGHEQRVAVVAFNKVDPQLLSTCGDDCRVIVWNWRSKSLIKQHERHEGKVSSVAWSPLDKDVLITGDDKGMVIAWNIATEEISQWVPEKDHIACLSHASNECHHLAIGYKSGQILVLDLRLKREAVISRLRGHDNEVQSMCWSPSPWQHDPGSEGGHVLLSGGKDQTIRVWSPYNEGMLQVLRLPAKGGGQRSRYRTDDGAAARGRVWVSIWWPLHSPRQFFSSFFSGDIVLWDVSKQKPKWTILGQSPVHTRPVFSILPVGDKSFITSSMDRQMVLWSLESHTPCWSIPTLGGFIYQLMVAPVDTSTIAMGVGDNMIRVLNTNTRGGSYQSVSLWQGLRSKITATCWHPERDGLLAFGTDDGKVGMFTAINPGKMPVLSRTFHKKTVYSLSFGPQCSKISDYRPEDNAPLCLFSCGGEGVVYQHHAISLQEEAIGIDAIIRDTNSFQHMLPLRSEVNWRPDGKVVAIGNDDGSIEVLSAPHLLMLCTIQVHHKIINCLRWFPHQSTQGQRSKLRYCLASGSNETVVCVHDLSSILEKDELVPLSAPVSSAFRSMTGHMLRVTALEWSPLGDGRLVSVSYDGTAQVWDVTTGEPVANFRGHHGRLLSVAWSYLDSETLFTGGEDFCLMKWKISECTHDRPPKDKKELNVKFYNTGTSNKDGKKKKKKNNKGNTSSSVFTKETASIPGTERPHSDKPSVGASTNGTSNSKVTGKMADALSPLQMQQKDLLSITELLERKRQELMGEQGAASVGDDVGVVAAGEASDGVGAVVETIRGSEIKVAEEKVEEKRPRRNLEDEDTAEEGYKSSHKPRRRKAKSYFPVSSQQDNRGKQYYLQDCKLIAQRKYGLLKDGVPPLDSSSIHLGLFTSRRDLIQTVDAEGAHHTEHGNHDNKIWMNVWQGRILQMIQKATHEGQLNDRLVAMAPQAGHDVWLETCRSYAKQLGMSGDPHKAASYYVCCHQVHDAVRVLKENRHYREAISLAMARLGTRDPVLGEIYRCWASQLEAEHCFEQAARCYLALDEPENAVRLLARSGNRSSLGTALEVALLTNQNDLLKSLVPRYAHQCLLNGDWSGPWQISSHHVMVMALHLVTIVHEVFCLTLNYCGENLSDLFEDPKHSLDVSKVSTRGFDDFSGCPLVVLDGQPLLDTAFSVWIERECNPWDRITREELSATIKQLFVLNLDSHVRTQFIISAAMCLAVDLLALAPDETDAGTERMLDHCCQQSQFDLMQATLSLVHPHSIANTSDPKQDAGKRGNLLPYYAYIAIYNQWWNMPRSPLSSQLNGPSQLQAKQCLSGLAKQPSADGQTQGPSGDGAVGDRRTLNLTSAPSEGANIIESGDLPLQGTDSCTLDCAKPSGTPLQRTNGDFAVDMEPVEGDASSKTSISVSQGSQAMQPREAPKLVQNGEPQSIQSQTEPDGGFWSNVIPSRGKGPESAWKVALWKSRICKPILVDTTSVQWYQLTAELEEIRKAKASLPADNGSSEAVPTLPSLQSGLKSENARANDKLESQALCDGRGTVGKIELSPGSSAVDGGASTNGLVGDHASCNRQGAAREMSLSSASLAVDGDDSIKGLVSEPDKGNTEPLGMVEGGGAPPPIWERYSYHSTTMEKLQAEEERIRSKISSLDMECLPPDPVESALVISSILSAAVRSGHADAASRSLLVQLLDWGTDNCCTAAQCCHFKKMRDRLNVDNNGESNKKT